MKKKPTIPEQIKAARAARAIRSQNLLASLSGLSQPQIHKVERGGGCSLATLQKIADALQMPITIHPTPPLVTGRPSPGGTMILTRGDHSER